MDNQNQFDLDRTLMEFADNKGTSIFTIRQSLEGIQVFGSLGAGKTSSSGRLIALHYLKAGYGGLILTAKAEERALWEEYARLTNRTEDLIIIEPGGKFFFNFLEYESSKSTGISANICQVLKTVIRSSEQKSGVENSDPFWETSADMLMGNIVELARLAYGKVSVKHMYDIALSAPKKDTIPDESRKSAFALAFEAAQDNVGKKIEKWRSKQSDKKKARMQEVGIFEEEVFKAIPDAEALSLIDQFFIETYRNLSEKTRSIIEFSFTGFLYNLLKDPVYSLFCRNPSNVTPDNCLHGKLILIDLPVKHYHKVGRDAQVLFKYIWQRAMEKRQVVHNERPVFLWADEAQQFLHEHDAEYQATARSSRIATVYISQNLPNYHANMGGSKSEHLVKSFLGTLGTKIFHANADLATNSYASELIGDAYTEDNSTSTTMGGNFSFGRNKSFKLERMVRPEKFVGLRTGGPLNNFIVTAYIHRQGNPFHDGLNHMKVIFKQNSII